MNWAGWILFILVALAVASMVSQELGAGRRDRAWREAAVGAVFLLLLWIAAQGPQP